MNDNIAIAIADYLGETVYSNIIKLRVAKATTNECSFPKFKVALVVCEEKYQKTAQFPSLKATRNDGEALIRALQELQFQVLAFTNLTLGQLRSAIELFASFIDEETYALFYYNGHAVGFNEDIYLATVESSLGEFLVKNGNIVIRKIGGIYEILIFC